MKYKLIKTYPGSVLLGTIVKSDDMNQYVTKNITIFSKEEIEGFSEFWEEVKEKDYEILDIAYSSGVICRYESPIITSMYENKDKFIKSFLASPAGYKIHSVKRLSDGEIFTIGDIISGFSFSSRAIKGFEIMPNGKINIVQDAGFSCLEDINKIKKPIFKTADGVDIFKGGGCWCVDNLLNYSHIFNITKHPNEKCFSTKEKAQEYIDLNKPKYSLQDIIDAYESPKPSMLFDSLMDNLQKLNR